MAVDAAGKRVGYGLGESDPDVARIDPNWHAITLARDKLSGKFQWARDRGATPGAVLDELTLNIVAEFQLRTRIPQTVDADGRPVLDYRTRVRLGSYPPPPPPRHALLTFSGTWAAPGTGYCSWVAQACPGVEEIPVQGPWSFGPLGGQPDAPSYRESVEIAVEWAIAWLLAHPTRTFLLGGYSQGGEAASRVRAELEPGGRLEHLRDNFVAGYTFGNPCRQMGHTFYKGKDPGGRGISSFNLSGMGDEWADMARPGDLYTTRPDTPSGQVEEEVYSIAIELGLGDPMGFMQAFIQGAIQIIQQMGGLTGIFGQLNLAMLPALLLASLAQLLGKPEANTPGLQAGINAAITGLKFIAASPPTAAHITYEQPIPDMPWMSYVDLARQHVNDWAARVPVAA